MKSKVLPAAVAVSAMAAMLVPHSISFAQTVRGALDRATEAQSNFARDRNVSVRQRPHPEYDAQGLRAGAFMAYPQVIVSGEYNDNIYATPADEVDDIIWRVKPSIDLRSTWSRHELTAFARGSINRYSDFKTEDNEEYGFGASGRLDVVRGTNITAGGDYNRITEPRTSANNATGSVAPIQYYLTQFNIAGQREYNRLRLGLRGDYRKFDYRDGKTTTGTAVEQDDRDREITSLLGRADYALSPATAFFVQGTVNKREYRLAGTPTRPVRDSDGYEILAGANFEAGNLIRGEIGAGYLSQNFDEAIYGKVDGFGGRAQLEWFPTQLTTVTMTAARSVEDSGIIGSSGFLSNNYSAQVDHELLRNVIVTGLVRYGDDDYEGIDRNDKRFNAGVSATYLMNRRLGVNVGYTYLDQESKGLNGGQNFKVNLFQIGLTGRF